MTFFMTWRAARRCSECWGEWKHEHTYGGYETGGGKVIQSNIENSKQEGRLGKKSTIYLCQNVYFMFIYVLVKSHFCEPDGKAWTQAIFLLLKHLNQFWTCSMHFFIICFRMLRICFFISVHKRAGETCHQNLVRFKGAHQQTALTGILHKL